MKKWVLLGVLAVVLVVSGFLVTQTQPTITKTVAVTLNVLDKPDFNLIVSPDTVNSPIGRVASYAVTVEKINDFAGDITFNVSGLPPEFLVSYFPSNTITVGGDQQQGIQIDIAVPDDVGLVGSYQVTITAESTQYN